MKSMNRFAIILALPLLLGACAHHHDVSPGVNGVNRVAVSNEDADEGRRDAISQANNFCEEHGKSAAVLKEKSTYQGTVDETTYRNAKNISKAAQVAGGMSSAAGTAQQNKGMQNAGGLLGFGGTVASSAMGKGYKVQMLFKCI